MNFDESLNYLSYKHKISKSDLEQLFNDTWSVALKHLQALDISKVNSQEDIHKQRGSVNFKGLGKFYYDSKSIFKYKNSNVSKSKLNINI